MSNSTELKSYLIDDGYLFDEQNNGSVIMLSGCWGVGKTHFWRNDIEPNLTQLKELKKAYVYVSLYGKENTELIKNEILLKAYENIEQENRTLERTISVFDNTNKFVSHISVLGVRFDVNSIEGFFTSKKVNKAKEYLLDGGIICLDDFERKSEKIQLNDLFGMITQLAQEMKCKVIIILNSDVFEGDDAKTFRNVKEKTVNKFLYFSPTIDELFHTIFTDEKYSPLIEYQDDILKWIKEVDELNARLYIQLLDNCLEWINKNCSTDGLKNLIFITVFFSKHHFTLEYKKTNDGTKLYSVVDYFSHKGFYEIADFLTRTAKQLFTGDRAVPVDESIHMLMSHINKNKDDEKKKSEDYMRLQNEEVKKHKELIMDFINYVYAKDIESTLDIQTYTKINDFIKNGILLRDR